MWKMKKRNERRKKERKVREEANGERVGYLLKGHALVLIEKNRKKKKKRSKD